MSKLGDKQTLLVSKLNTKLSDKYTIYTQIEPDGYIEPFILLRGYYESADNSSDCTSQRFTYKFDLEMGVISEKDYEDTREEELRVDFESILELSGVVLDEYFAADNFNKNGEPVKTIEFTIKY